MAASKATVIALEVMCSIRPFLHTADTGVSSVVPSYPLILFTIAAQLLTGHNNASPDAIWVTVSIRSSFFWRSKVIETA